MDIPVELTRILITELGEQQVIFLKETNGERQFPILIGIHEAVAIDHRLKGVKFPRPMTHDLLAGVIESMGGRLEKIVINDLRDHTFFATLYIRRGNEMIEVDSRPSDAIALGAAMDTPLFVAEHVFETIVNAEPTTRQERLELLRQRKNMLAEQIEALQTMLEDPDFQAEASEATMKSHQRQMEKMREEHDAIDAILRKLG
ncbi:MAG: bifunctional nuclease family protein [Phycisphaerae bacterium]|nr:bifunctional nuclease family protein [Phycisphaerae bacterium]